VVHHHLSQNLAVMMNLSQQDHQAIDDRLTRHRDSVTNMRAQLDGLQSTIGRFATQLHSITTRVDGLFDILQASSDMHEQVMRTLHHVMDRLTANDPRTAHIEQMVRMILTHLPTVDPSQASSATNHHPHGVPFNPHQFHPSNMPPASNSTPVYDPTTVTAPATDYSGGSSLSHLATSSSNSVAPGSTTLRGSQFPTTTGPSSTSGSLLSTLLNSTTGSMASGTNANPAYHPASTAPSPSNSGSLHTFTSTAGTHGSGSEINRAAPGQSFRPLGNFEAREMPGRGFLGPSFGGYRGRGRGRGRGGN
jgi:hypothetical protein